VWHRAAISTPAAPYVIEPARAPIPAAQCKTGATLRQRGRRRRAKGPARSICGRTHYRRLTSRHFVPQLLADGTAHADFGSRALPLVSVNVAPPSSFADVCPRAQSPLLGRPDPVLLGGIAMCKPNGTSSQPAVPYRATRPVHRCCTARYTSVSACDHRSLNTSYRSCCAVCPKWPDARCCRQGVLGGYVAKERVEDVNCSNNS
jgi:hypothetical protein